MSEKKKFKFSWKGSLDDLQKDGKILASTVVLAVILMFVSCLAVFFTSVQGAEKVLVPNVVGKSLADALIEMQKKELYPKIQLKFSEVPGDKGTILEQDPSSGSIVKAYRRVNLTVSRGIPQDFIQDYSGKKIDEVRNTLEFLFSGEDSLLEIAPTVYKTDDSPAGTILAQYPGEGFPLDQKTKIFFVVSSGKDLPRAAIPQADGSSIKQFLEKIGSYKVIFDFSAEENPANPENGKIVLEKSEGEVKQYERLDAKVLVQPRTDEKKNVQGVFSVELPEYNYPVPVKFVSVDSDGKNSVLADFVHPGKNFSIPYDVRKNSTLILYVMDEEYARILVE